MRSIFVLIFLILIVNCNRKNANDIENIKQKFDSPAGNVLYYYFEKTGGIDKFMTMKSIKITGDFETIHGKFKFHIFKKSPNRLYESTIQKGKKIVHRAYNGKKCWQYHSDRGYNVYQPGRVFNKIVENAEFESPFINLEKKGHRVDLMEPETINEITYSVIRLTKYNSLERENVVYYYLFDQKSGLMKAKRHIVDYGPGKGTIVEIWYFDYKLTDYGILMPYKIVQKINGLTTFSHIIKQYNINHKIDDEIFEMK